VGGSRSWRSGRRAGGGPRAQRPPAPACRACPPALSPLQPPIPAARCLEYLLLRTNKDRALAVGNAKSPTVTKTVTVNRAGGFLGALRGWVAPDGLLQQLQLVWAVNDCDPAAQAAPEPAPAAEAPAAAAPEATVEPAPAATAAPAEAVAVAVSEEPAAPAEATAAPAPAAEPVAAEPVAAEPVAAANASAPAGASCRPKPEMCDVSGRGKCKYGSCSANGLGKDAPLVCIGTNFIPTPLALLGNKCGHLACKLAVPGCKTAVLGGGNCVGTVVATQDSSKLHPNAAKYLGHPCIETTPTGGVIDIKGIDIGLPAREYVLAGWKVCDCAAEEPAASGGKVLKLPSLPKPSLPQLPKMPSLPRIPGFPGGRGNESVAKGPTKLGMMRDLIAAQLNQDKSDPFANFVDPAADASAAAPAAEPAAAEPVAAAPPMATADGVVMTPEAAPAAAAPSEGETVTVDASSALAPEQQQGVVGGESVVVVPVLSAAAPAEASAPAAQEVVPVAAVAAEEPAAVPESAAVPEGADAAAADEGPVDLGTPDAEGVLVAEPPPYAADVGEEEPVYDDDVLVA
jgi:hypothetical protein